MANKALLLRTRDPTIGSAVLPRGEAASGSKLASASCTIGVVVPPVSIELLIRLYEVLSSLPVCSDLQGRAKVAEETFGSGLGLEHSWFQVRIPSACSYDSCVERYFPSKSWAKRSLGQSKLVHHRFQSFLWRKVQVLLSTSCEGDCCPVSPVLAMVDIGVEMSIELVVQLIPRKSWANVVEVVHARTAS